jgi:lysophospholipase L1-like esterase
MRTFARRLAVGTLVALAALALVEGALRIAGRPDGRFRFSFVNQPGLYAPNLDQPARWGPFAYRLRTNSLGLRSPEPIAPRPARRIVAIGDSVTDGFFVDNDETWPAQLRRALADQHRLDADVQSVARGQASIDKELGLLERVGLALAPDLVILTFVTNDIAELAGKTRAQLDGGMLGYQPGGARQWWITRTAIGELLFEWRVRWAAPRFGKNFDARAIADNDRYEDNARLFRARAPGDGMILQAPFAPETEALVATWFSVFDRFVARCREHKVPLVVVYYPAYSQIYLDGDSFEMRDRLRAACARAGVAFLDLTQVLRAHGRERPLHFAPIDFHPNAAGYALIGRAVAQFLVERGLVK